MTVSATRQLLRSSFAHNAPVLSKALRFGAMGAIGALAGGFIDELINPLLRGWHGGVLVTMIETGVWFAVFGAFTALSLLSGVSKYLRDTFSLTRSFRPAVTLGAQAGFVAGAIAEWLYQFGPTDPLRIFCWGLAGGLLGFGLSFGIPNLGRWRGLLAGVIGGLIGGGLFVELARFSEGFGRLTGLAIIGFAIGTMLVLAESVFRKAWLEVSYGPNERRVVTLGPEPVSISGTPDNCTVCVAGWPTPGHRYWSAQGQLWMESGKTRTTVAAGHSQKFGKTTVTVCTSAAVRSRLDPSPVRGLTLWIAGRGTPLEDGVHFTPSAIPGLVARQSNVIAEVVRHPEEPSVLGLRNASTKAWTLRSASGHQRIVQPGQSLRLEAGARVAFGLVEGEIR